MYHASAYYGHRCNSSRHHCHILARVRFTMVSIRTTAGCRIMGRRTTRSQARYNCGATTPWLLTCHRRWPIGHRFWTVTNFWKFYLYWGLYWIGNAYTMKKKFRFRGDSNSDCDGHIRIHSHSLPVALASELCKSPSLCRCDSKSYCLCIASCIGKYVKNDTQTKYIVIKIVLQ